MQENPEWNYTEICIGNVKSLLNTHDVEVESPDGYVEVLDYIEKGYHKQYVLVSSRGEIIKCSGGHLFETDIGWVSAKAIADNEICVNVLHDDGGFHRATCVATNTEIPIVDISVNHNNRRYYTNGVSSHNTGVGKSLVMCHMGAAAFAHGKNVLYITAEMAEERIAERIDANLLDVTLDELKALPRNVFQKKIERIKDKSPGRLVIKEYPTGVAHAGHFRHLLNDLRLKKNFTPDIIFIDYLNICSSSRIKGAASANTYVLVKSIAEEIRGLAMEFNVPIVTATQANRCLSLDTIVEKIDGSKIQIKDISLGDKILSSDGKFVTVNHIYPVEKQKTYLIKTKSGKTIKTSSKHIFPSPDGFVSIENGLSVGTKLFSKKSK